MEMIQRISAENKIYLDEISNRLFTNHAAIMVGAGFSKNAIPNTSSCKSFSTWDELGDAFFEKLYGKNVTLPKKEYLNVLKLAEEVEATFGRPVLDDIIINKNPDLEYVIPKEGSNVWIDSWVIPKNAQNKENAEVFINFLCRPDIAKMNFDYITYSTPNTAARELIEDDAIRNSTIAFPDASELERCETFNYLGTKFDNIYNELWREIKSK